MIRDTNLYLHSVTGTKGKVNKMAITSGFFNSLNGDRKYNAAQMSEYFQGIISDGVLANYLDKMKVSAGSGMGINVASGRAFIDSRWIESNGVEQFTLDASHPTLNRYDAIVIRLDYSSRDISFNVKKGENASDPVKPAITNSETVKELCLAYVLIPAGSTSISAVNITDTRPDSRICGWVTGIIEQVDTTTLFEQWTAAYNENIAEMESWETAQKNAFDAWFNTLTSELNVNTYIQEYEKDVTLTSMDNTTIALDMDGYTYESTDIFFVYVNGLLARRGYDYTINTGIDPIGIDLTLVPSEEWVYIKVLKSKVGFNTLADSTGATIVTSNNEAVDI